MATNFTNIQVELDALRQEVAAFEAQAVVKLKHATLAVLEALFKQTPVWSGETAAGYGIGIGAASHNGQGGYSGGDPGDTRKPHPLAGENNRAGAENAARGRVQASLAGLTRLADINFGNGIAESKWNLIDSGAAPAPGAERNPAGVQKPAELLAKSQLGADFS